MKKNNKITLQQEKIYRKLMEIEDDLKNIQTNNLEHIKLSIELEIKRREELKKLGGAGTVSFCNA